ncbi:hypothetical protein L1049_018920 [Liquidambar formosana]|uniref:RNA uridylyltransferase n=1 Tax=Liquidambar formosana TaxID=63359 RepID=A0AAP0WNS7_LIQFO
MAGGGGHTPPPTGGEFLLSLLQRPRQPQPPPSATRATPPSQSFTLDPAVAAVGPTILFPPWPSSNGHDLSTPRRPPPPWPQSHPYPPNFFLPGFSQNPWPPPGNHFPGNQFPANQIPGNQFPFGEDAQRLGFQQKRESKIMFGSFPCEIQNHEGVLKSNPSDGEGLVSKLEVSKGREMGLGFNGLDRDRQSESRVSSHSHRIGNYDSREQERRSAGGVGRQLDGPVYRSSPETRPPPPGFPSQPRGGGKWDGGNRRRNFEHNVGVEMDNSNGLNNWGFTSNDENEQGIRVLPEGRKTRGNTSRELELSAQLDRPGPSTGSKLHSATVSDIEESMSDLHGEIDEVGDKPGYMRQDNMRRDGGSIYRQGLRKVDDSGEHLIGSLLVEDGSDDKHDRRQHHNSRDKDIRSDTRGQRLLSQRIRNFKRQMECRIDIEGLNAPFLAIYESLIPAEEEKAKQKQLLTLLEKLVSKEWPKARLYLYGSCANSFDFSKSDIDVCLTIEEADIKKSEILLKLADILQSDNLQNVQALTRARVPIVKLKDPVTGISCDICINNVLAVVNTKLLRDYAQIDVRLRQLAFIVKHWAKSRGVNETYQGTLSSYAYVLMCIHFLQQRKPAILPCLQGMETTYSVTVEDVDCAFFDRVEKLRDFGSHNKESIAQLVWAFFNYWAYCHDYTDAVISVRTGNIISKRLKDWTRRIGNDRHLICIEDPFETSHDLGRVVDKHSIKVLREEFERAADILQYDPNPCVALFEPYVPS